MSFNLDRAIRWSFRISQCTLLLALMLGTASIAAIPELRWEGPVFIAWLLLESLSAGILFATFVEVIFAAQYQLQARGYAIFQGVKVLLWTAIVAICVAAASAETRGWEGALVVLLIGVLVLALFAGSLVYALVVLRGERPVPEEDEAAPLLADSESD